jgi:hypothetical protein
VRRVTWSAVAVSSLAIVAGLAGCTSSGHPHQGPTGSAAAPPPPTVSASPAVSRQPSATEPPVVAKDPAQPQPLSSSSQKVLYRTEGKRGSANLTVLPQVARGTLGIVVLCNGPGGILVRIGDVVSFGVGCGTDPGVYNEIELSSAKKSVSLSVTGSTKNEWALTMGWTSHIDPHPAD